MFKHYFNLLKSGMESTNAIHGYLLQVLYLLRSSKQQQYDISIQTQKSLLNQLVQLKLPQNRVIGKAYLEILLEILLK